ncbi:MAG: hypothetical protein LUD29_05935 [Clostridia bacterium]|nr:hypothetical protein [Clostridia bacterium]
MEKLSKSEKLFNKLMKKIIPALGDRFTDECSERFEQELEYIGKYDALDDVMALRDVIMYAKDAGIEYSFRGEGVCTSYICHMLGIIELDPMKYGLYFETWLNGLYPKPTPLVTVYSTGEGVGKLAAKVRECEKEGVIDVREDGNLSAIAKIRGRGRKVDFGLYDNRKVYAALEDNHLFPEMGLSEDLGEVFNSFHGETLSDIANALAIYRKAMADGVGIDEISENHIYEVARCLGDTKGRFVYREQAMAIMEAAASFSLGHADKTVDVIASGKEEGLKKEEDSFVFCCMGNDTNMAYAKKIWCELSGEKNLQSRVKSVYDAADIYRRAYMAIYFPN